MERKNLQASMDDFAFQTTLLFAQQINNNNLTNITPNVRQANTSNGPILQQHMNGGLMTNPTSIVRVNQPQTMSQTHHIAQNPGQFQGQTAWTNSVSPSSQPQFTLQKAPQGTPILQYTTVKNGESKRKTLFVHLSSIRDRSFS